MSDAPTTALGARHHLRVLAALDAPTAAWVAGDEPPGLVQAVHDRTAGDAAVELTALVGVTLADLHRRLDDDPALLADIDVLLVSVGDELTRDRSGAALESEVTEALAAVIAHARRQATRVLAVNLCTFDPGTEVFAHRDDVEPDDLRAHRLDAVLVEASMQHGISIIDADRAIAGVGAARCVERLGHYRPEGRAVVLGELLRVLEDYGFFDDRPVLEQVGRPAATR